METGPHHTDVPFQQKERYKENIKACILYDVSKEAEYDDLDPTETERIWLEKYGETLNQMVDHDDIPLKVKFNIAHVRKLIEKVSLQTDE